MTRLGLPQHRINVFSTSHCHRPTFGCRSITALPLEVTNKSSFIYLRLKKRQRHLKLKPSEVIRKHLQTICFAPQRLDYSLYDRPNIFRPPPYSPFEELLPRSLSSGWPRLIDFCTFLCKVSCTAYWLALLDRHISNYTRSTKLRVQSSWEHRHVGIWWSMVRREIQTARYVLRESDL